MEALEKSLNKKTEVLTKKLDQHIGHFIISKIAENKKDEPIDLSPISDIPDLKKRLQELDSQVGTMHQALNFDNQVDAQDNNANLLGIKANLSNLGQRVAEIQAKLSSFETGSSSSVRPPISGLSDNLLLNSLGKKVASLSNEVNILKSTTGPKGIQGKLDKQC